MTLLELRTMVRDLLGEPTAAYWTDAMITNFINRAALEVYAEVAQSGKGFFETSANITAVVNQELYTLPTGLWKINLVERSDLTPKINVLPIDIVEKNRYSKDRIGFSPGRERYFLSGNSLGIAPTPDTTAAIYKVWYIPTMTVMALDADTLPTEFRDLHHDVIVWGALLRASMRDRELYRMWEPNFQRLWLLLKSDTSARQTQAPMQIIDMDADF